MRMLIIDDSLTMRRYLDSLAQDLSIDTAQAVDGKDALALLDGGGAVGRAPFDIALVDWDMPRMNGVQFVSAVRTRPEYADLKLMMLTSHNSLSDIRAALAAGADDYLMKPVDGEMLAEKLKLLGLLE